MECTFCGKALSNKGKSHEKYCEFNPNRIISPFKGKTHSIETRNKCRDASILSHANGNHDFECRYCGETFKALNFHEPYCERNPDSGPARDERTKILKSRTTKVSKLPNTLYDVSSRTRSKILARLGIGCSNCGWNEASCDLHHIVPRSKGGTDLHDNITNLCPNCHRLAHSGKLNSFVTFVEQIGDRWKDFYNGVVEKK